MGDVVTGRPYAEGEGHPPVSEHLKPDGHCQFRGLDMSEIDSGEQLRQVTLSGAGELCLVTHPRIEVARGPPERGEGTAVPGEIPYTRGDQTTRSGDPRHLPQPPHWISHEVHDQLGKREVETVIGEGKTSAAPQRTSTAGKRARIAATNAAEGSIAETALAPNRCTNCVVRAPGPQPTSNAR